MERMMRVPMLVSLEGLRGKACGSAKFEEGRRMSEVNDVDESYNDTPEYIFLCC